VSAVEPSVVDITERPHSGRKARVVSGRFARTELVPERMVGTVSIVVPTYNTGPVIPDVLRALVGGTEGVINEILVIDNASSDGTPDIVRGLIANEPEIGAFVRLLENPTNLGYGGSIKRGFDELVGTSEYIAVMHSDAQCDSARTVMDLVTAAAAAHGPDIVLASRFMPGAITREYSTPRRLANIFFNQFTRALSGLRMSDAGTGIMLIRSETLARMPFERLTSGLQFHPQLNLIIYSDPRHTVAEVPLSWRDAEVSVKFSLMGYALTLTKMLLTFAWHRRIRRRPTADAVVASAPGT